MLSENDFYEKFSNYPDEELFKMQQNPDGYSEAALLALNRVIDKKGGIQRLNNAIEQKMQVAVEIGRIRKETNELSQTGFDQEFINRAITSTILSKEKVQEIISNQNESFTAEKEDKKVDQQTIGRSVLAGIVATLISGAAFGGFLIVTGAIQILIFVGLAILCYAIIKGITRKSFNNAAVIVTTFISFVLAIIIGYLLVSIFGVWH